jgi:hypothetical protein
MSTIQPSRSTPARELREGGAANNAWLAFAGVLLVLDGIFGALWGLAAIINDNVVTVGGRGGAVIWDLTAWGWIGLAIGLAMILAGVGLLIGNAAARWLAVLIVGVHAVIQFPSLSAFPLWSIFAIALDVVILYQLIVRWRGAD